MTDTSYNPMNDPFGYGNPNAANNPSNPTYGTPSASASSPSYYTPSPWEYNQGSPVPTTSNYLSNPQGTGLYDWSRNMGLQAAQGAAAPQLAQLQGQQAGYGIGIYGALAGQNQEAGYLQSTYDLGQRRLANQQAGLNVDIGANARQPGFLTALHDIAGKGFDLTRQGEAANAAVNRRALESQLTARGAFTSVGGQQGRYDIATDLARQTQGTNLQQQAGDVRFNENMAQTADQKQKLDIAGKDLGISGDQLNNELQKGLDRLHLSTSMSVADLTNKINSSNLEEAAVAQKIWTDALGYSDYFQRSGLYQGPNAAAGVYGPTGAGTEQTYGGGGVTVR